MTLLSDPVWTDVCSYLDIPIERAVAALVGQTQIALVRDYDGVVHAVDNWDPFSSAFVMARGLVGSHQDRHTLTSPSSQHSLDPHRRCDA